jgi:putative DNA primase/helicase
MEFIDFARLHGLIVTNVIPNSVIRCPTEDKPHKTNGSYFFSPTISWIQNWSTHSSPVFWTSDGSPPPAEEYKKHLDDYAAKRAILNKEAVELANHILEGCEHTEHPYLIAKHISPPGGLVDPRAGTLYVPVVDVSTEQLTGLQIIQDDPDRAGSFRKRFLYGMRTEAGVYNLRPGRTTNVLCEGYATGLSIKMAQDAFDEEEVGVIVCFSAYNLSFVSQYMDKKNTFIYADNDPAGLAAARKSGLLYVNSDTIGNDANDDMVEFGLDYVGNKLLRFTQ